MMLMIFCFLPILSILMKLFIRQPRAYFKPWKQFYSLIIYMSCIPGMFSTVLTAYILFFTHENLLNLNAIVYFLPIVSMIVTLIILRTGLDFNRLPGFKRLYGLMIMIGISFFLALFIQKMNIWIVFGGSVQMLFVLAIGIFLLLKWAGHLLFGEKNTHQRFKGI